jgi:hypothetical protein
MAAVGQNWRALEADDRDQDALSPHESTSVQRFCFRALWRTRSLVQST